MLEPQRKNFKLNKFKEEKAVWSHLIQAGDYSFVASIVEMHPVIIIIIIFLNFSKLIHYATELEVLAHEPKSIPKVAIWMDVPLLHKRSLYVHTNSLTQEDVIPVCSAKEVLVLCFLLRSSFFLIFRA